MRISALKVVKFGTFILTLCFFNIWISYSINLWSFKNLNDRGKVPKLDFEGRRFDSNYDGGSLPSPQMGKSKEFFQKQSSYETRSFDKIFRYQRSAKSVNNKEKETLDLSRSDTLASNRNSLKTLVAHPRNHGPPAVKDVIKTSEKRDKNLNKNKDRNSNRDLKRQTILKSKSDQHSIHLNKLPNTELSDIFISVKTTSKYHKSRIQLILNTWYLLSRSNVSLH